MMAPLRRPAKSIHSRFVTENSAGRASTNRKSMRWRTGRAMQADYNGKGPKERVALCIAWLPKSNASAWIQTLLPSPAACFHRSPNQRQSCLFPYVPKHCKRGLDEILCPAESAPTSHSYKLSRSPRKWSRHYIRHGKDIAYFVLTAAFLANRVVKVTLTAFLPSCYGVSSRGVIKPWLFPASV